MNLLIIFILSLFLSSCTSVKSAPVSHYQIPQKSVNTYELNIVDVNGKPLDGVKIGYRLFDGLKVAKDGTYITKSDGKLLILTENTISDSTLSYTVEKDGFIPQGGEQYFHSFETKKTKTVTMTTYNYKSREIIDKSQFDFSISQLPPMYKGDDIQKVFNRLANDMDIGGAEQIGLSGHADKTIYNFVLPGKMIQKTGRLKYDAGSKSLKVMFSFGMMFDDGKLVNNLINLKMTDNTKGSYLASNIFGTTAKVKRYTGVDYDISVQNSNNILTLSQYTQIKLKESIDMERKMASKINSSNIMDEETLYNIIIKFQTTPELTRLSMEDINILFVCKPKKPTISTGKSGHDATLDHPISIYAINKCVNVDVLEIWVFNAKSGEIYYKQQVM